MRGIERFKMAALAYARKSQGKVEPRDVLYGTFLRFDSQQRGRINEKGVRDVCAELGVTTCFVQCLDYRCVVLICLAVIFDVFLSFVLRFLRLFMSSTINLVNSSCTFYVPPLPSPC